MRIPGNFDRWMFNYKEGNLSPEEVDYFESFMLNNPDYAADADAWDNAYVRQEDVEYHNADLLLKEKGAFHNWRNWAAILILFISIGSGIWFSNPFNAERSDNDRIANSALDVQSFLSPVSGTEAYNKAMLIKRSSASPSEDDLIQTSNATIGFKRGRSKPICFVK